MNGLSSTTSWSSQRCPYDGRTQSYVGKTRVIDRGRVADQMTEAIYALLKRIDDIVRANTGPSNRRLLPIQLPLFILVHPNDSICLRVYSIMEISPPQCTRGISSRRRRRTHRNIVTTHKPERRFLQRRASPEMRCRHRRLPLMISPS